MKIEQKVDIARPVDQVWKVLGDVPLVVGCIPGAELGEQLADDRYRGVFRLKVGPLVAKIDGEGEIVRDDASKTGRIIGRGIDKRGGSRVGATVNYNVMPASGGSTIAISADVELSGPLAQVGRTGIIEDVAKRLTQEFTAELEQKLQVTAADAATLPEAPPVPSETATEPAKAAAPAKQFDVGSAVTSSIMRRLGEFVRRLLGRSMA